ncbi:MAG: hypothetical protein QME96_16255, partial [Myxococcota bacterium]|nr:hypothetical protein [Myxococcota bacterium]
ASGGRSANVVRRRDSSVIGGWVSARVEGARVAVDEFVFLSNGEWRRRTVEVDPASGLVLAAGTDPAGVEDGGSAGREPGETHGIWHTEEGFLVLIERGPGAREELRVRYELDERAEKLTLPAGEAGDAVAYHRYR